MRTRWTEVQGSPEGQKSRGLKSEGGALNALRVWRETKSELDEWKQRSMESGSKSKVILRLRAIEYTGVVLIYL